MRSLTGNHRTMVRASCLALCAAWASPVWAQAAPAGPPDQAQPAPATPAPDAAPPESDSSSGTDIFSKNTITVLLNRF